MCIRDRHFAPVTRCRLWVFGIAELHWQARLSSTGKPALKDHDPAGILMAFHDGRVDSRPGQPEWWRMAFSSSRAKSPPVPANLDFEHWFAGDCTVTGRAGTVTVTPPGPA
eukprot:3935697-Rhodomonas_salina.2